MILTLQSMLTHSCAIWSLLYIGCRTLVMPHTHCCFPMELKKFDHSTFHLRRRVSSLTDSQINKSISLSHAFRFASIDIQFGIREIALTTLSLSNFSTFTFTIFSHVNRFVHYRAPSPFWANGSGWTPHDTERDKTSTDKTSLEYLLAK